MRRYLEYVALIEILSTSCDATPEVEPRAINFVPKCASHDGRCVVCSWSEAGETRCMVTIFSGSCPRTATHGDACPPNPVSACDGSTAGYFDALQSGGELSNGYADAKFYYIKDVTGERSTACRAMNASIEPYRWIEY